MARLPLCSSQQIIRALERAGFQPASPSSGSHLPMKKRIGRRTVNTVVVLGKQQVPKGTLRKILRLAQLTNEEFISLL